MKLTALTNTVAIDVGTSYTRIYYKGTITEEPSVVAYDAIDGSIIAIGGEAYEMLEKNPDTIVVERPLSRGVIKNFDLTCQLVNGLLKKIIVGVLRPKVFVTVPCGVTDVERRAMCDVIRESEIQDVCVIESPIAAAIGASCDVTPARGMMIVDIGGGKCDIGVISLGQIVIGRSLKYAGNDFTTMVVDSIAKKHNLSIGKQSAERLKLSIGCAVPRFENNIDEISGYNKKLKKPEKIAVRADELREAFSPILMGIIAEIKAVLDEVPTELLGDITDDGILLTGGGAQLYGMAKFLKSGLGLKVFLAEDAEMCAIRGAGYIADNAEKFSDNTYIYTKG